MRYAIDRYNIGHEEEVCADAYEGTYIPQRQTRFFCPECNEIVFWRSKGGSHPNQFYHKVKTERSPECDKRVDGRSGLSLYERVGLPLYLENVGGRYQLSIGFPAVGEKALSRATSSNTKVTIYGGHRERSLPVNQINFLEDSTTLVPIGFVPLAGENYKIQITSSSGTWDISHRWSDYADGFELGGAIFSYGETGGKKIRRGDSISPGLKYYVVSKRLVPQFSEIQASIIGKINLNDSDYCVYSFVINVSVDDDIRYAAISNYIKRNFGIGLLATQPGIVPLWPPVTIQDDFVPISAANRIYCSIQSGNDTPNVYYYAGRNASSMMVSKEHNAFLAEIPLVQSTATVSVDRKYIGREITFRWKAVQYPLFQYEIGIESIDGTPIGFENITCKDIEHGIRMKSNAKLDVCLGSKSNIWQSTPIREENTEIAIRNDPRDMVLIVEHGIMAHYRIQNARNTGLDLTFSISDIRKNACGATVPLPRWAAVFLQKCFYTGNTDFVNAVYALIHDGTIPIGVLRLLAKLSRQG